MSEITNIVEAAQRIERFQAERREASFTMACDGGCTYYASMSARPGDHVVMRSGMASSMAGALISLARKLDELEAR